MNVLTTIKKIIFGIFLCFVFLGFAPVHVFAGDTSAYTGFNNVYRATNVVTVHTANEDGDVTYTVNLSSDTKVNSGTNPANPTYLLPAVQEVQKNAGVPITTTGSTYTVADNTGNYSVYNRPPGGNTDGSGDKLIMTVANGNVYVPPGGSIPKASGNPGSTDINTERGFTNAIDTANDRQLGTTYGTLSNVDQLQQNVQTLNTQENQLNKLLQQQAADDAALNDPNTEGANAMSQADRAKLDQQVKDLQDSINTTRGKVQSGTDATSATKINTDVCPSGITDIGKLTNFSCVVTILAILANISLKLSSFALYIIGQLFDYSIEIAINSAEFINRLGIVEPFWAAIRDFLNMTFIFILVFIAWQILLNKSNYNAKSNVARLVLVAILINFSLFAAKIAVDGSNIISLNIYEAMKTKGGSSADYTARGSVSARIMTTLGLPGIYSFQSAFDGNAIPGCGGVPGAILTVGFFGTILIVITIMTFLLAAILFFLRMLNIIVLFATSPLWVWGYVIDHPAFRKQTDAWEKNMLHVIKFPVVYMLILYGCLALFAQLNTAQTTTGKGVTFVQMVCQATTQGTNNGGIFTQLPLILNFIVVIACLFGALYYAAKETKGGKGGTHKIAASVSDKFATFSKKITSGAAQNLYNKSTSAIASGASFVGNKTYKGAAAVASAPGRGIKYAARQAGYKATDWISNKSAELATKGNSPKIQTAFAMLSQKTKDAKILGETKEEGIKRRTASAVTRQEILSKVQDEQTKIDTEAVFKAKNPNGDYAKYVNDKINLIEDIQLGRLKTALGEDGVTSNSKLLREGVLDDKGNIVGGKLDQSKLFENAAKIRKYSEKNGSLLTNEKSSRWGFITEERAKARLKTKEKAFEVARNRVRGGEITAKKKEEEIERLREILVKQLPDVDSIDVKNSDITKYHSAIRSYVQSAKKVMEERDKKLSGTKDPQEARVIEAAAQTELAELKLTALEKRKEEETKIQDKIEKLLNDVEKINEKNKKK